MRDRCHKCGTIVNPADCHIIWTYATSSDESYCDPCGREIRDPYGDRFLSEDAAALMWEGGSLR